MIAWGSHIIYDAVDKFYTPVVRKAVVIFNSIVPLLWIFMLFIQRSRIFQDSFLYRRNAVIGYIVQIWRLCESLEVEGHISSLSFANMVYILRHKLQKERIISMITALSLIFKFEPLDQGDLYGAAACMWDDFEDAVQFAAALKIHADCIITRNKDDYRDSMIPLMTPKEFLQYYVNNEIQ